MSNKRLLFSLNQKYVLEDIHLLSKTVLNRMCWRFDVSGWVGNVPKLLREAMCNIPRFITVYQSLSLEQQAIVAFLAKTDGIPVTLEEVAQQFTSTIPKKELHNNIEILIREGWLLEGDNPHSLLAVPEFHSVLQIIPAFQDFLKAELSREHQSNVSKGQYFTDLLEMAAFIYVEKPKLTNKGFMSKTVLRRLVLRLSAAAVEQWEEAANEHLYTENMRMVLRGLQNMNAVQIMTDAIDSRYYHFETEKWDDFVFSPATHRLLAVLSWQLSRINALKHGVFPFIVKLFQQTAILEGDWQTSGYLMARSVINDGKVVFNERDPFGSEAWLEAVVLEPFLYLGLFEQTTEKLATPWLKEGQKDRTFWRLTAQGMMFAQWLSEQCNAAEVMLQISKVDIFNKNIDIAFATLFEKWQQVLPVEMEEQLIIQPDLSFFVPRFAPPYLLWILSVFAVTQIQDYVYQGSFTRESVLHALKGGVAMDELFTVIADHSKVPPAETVLRTLQQWAAAYDRTIFAKTMLLACDTAEMATEITAQSKLAAFIIGQVAPKLLVIKPEGESVIRKWLEKKNWVPRPGVVTGTGLYQWLNK